jgi:hypothetical protein
MDEKTTLVPMINGPPHGPRAEHAPLAGDADSAVVRCSHGNSHAMVDHSFT